MEWKKPTPEALALFEQICPPQLERKKMFGLPCAFVNGNLCFGVWEDGLMFRADAELQAEVVAAGGAPFDPMGKGVMKAYVCTPPDLSPSELRGWLARAIAHTGALPPKMPKATKPKAGRAPKG